MPSSACVQNVMEIGFSSVSNSCLHYSQTECTKFLGTNLKGKESNPLLSERVQLSKHHCYSSLSVPWGDVSHIDHLIDSLRWNTMLKDSRSSSDLLVGMGLSYNYHLPLYNQSYKTYGGERTTQKGT